MHSKTFAVLFAVSVLILVVDLIRRQRMTFKYSVSWLGTCFVVLFFAMNDHLLAKISSRVGFTLPSNFVFFLLLIYVIVLSLLITIQLNEQNGRAESLAQATARLEYRIQKLEKGSKH